MRSKNFDSSNRITSGFSELDRITGGWQDKDLVVIASRPSMGKTSFALSMMRNISMEYDIGVAFFSLEMSSDQLIKRWFVLETETYPDNNKIWNNLHWVEIMPTVGRFISAPVFIDDTPALSVSGFHEKCRRLVQHHHIRIVFIDFLSLMTTDKSKGNRNQDIEDIIYSLKAIAEELSITVIVLSQTNKKCELRTGLQGMRPQLDDLRDSADTIYQYADTIIFIYRPEYYGLTEDENNNSLNGIAEIIVAKCLGGTTGSTRLLFKKQFAKFVEPDHPSI